MSTAINDYQSPTLNEINSPIRVAKYSLFTETWIDTTDAFWTAIKTGQVGQIALASLKIVFLVAITPILFLVSLFLQHDQTDRAKTCAAMITEAKGKTINDDKAWEEFSKTHDSRGCLPSREVRTAVSKTSKGHPSFGFILDFKGVSWLNDPNKNKYKGMKEARDFAISQIEAEFLNQDCQSGEDYLEKINRCLTNIIDKTGELGAGEGVLFRMAMVARINGEKFVITVGSKNSRFWILDKGKKSVTSSRGEGNQGSLPEGFEFGLDPVKEGDTVFGLSSFWDSNNLVSSVLRNGDYTTPLSYVQGFIKELEKQNSEIQEEVGLFMIPINGRSTKI